MNARMYENIYAKVKTKITFLSQILNACRTVNFQLFSADKKITRMTCNLFFYNKEDFESF